MEEQHLPVPFLIVLFFFSTYYFLPGLSSAAGNESFVFSGFDGAAAGGNLALDGVANISSEGLLELTNNGVNVKGHAFYRTPFQFKESPNGTARSFSAAFVFGILPGNPADNVSSDGMAFLVSPTTDLSNSLSEQYMGFLDSAAISRIFAVELDTIQNLDMRDIDENHVGVDIGSMYSAQAHAAGFYGDENDRTLFNNLTLDCGQAMQVWVDYDGKTEELNVTLAPMEVVKPSKPLLSSISDLSAVLTEQAYVGFSGGTGPIKSRHFVLAWSFAINGPAPPIDYNKMPKLPSTGRINTLSKVLNIALPAAAGAVIILVQLL